jgi:hypothetical protein
MSLSSGSISQKPVWAQGQPIGAICDFRFWRKADITTALIHVRFGVHEKLVL